MNRAPLPVREAAARSRPRSRCAGISSGDAAEGGPVLERAGLVGASRVSATRRRCHRSRRSRTRRGRAAPTVRSTTAGDRCLGPGGFDREWFWSASPPGCRRTAGPANAGAAGDRGDEPAGGADRDGSGASPGRVGLVGLPVWMWAQHPDSTTWGPVTRTATAAGFTVTATAKVTKVVWAMGDGETVVCRSPGHAVPGPVRDEVEPGLRVHATSGRAGIGCGRRRTGGSTGPGWASPGRSRCRSRTPHW